MVSIQYLSLCSISFLLGSSVTVVGFPLPPAGSRISTESGQSLKTFDERGDDGGSVAVETIRTTGQIHHPDKRAYLLAQERKTELPGHYDERSSHVGSRGVAPFELRANKVRKSVTSVTSKRPKAKNPAIVSKPGGPKKPAPIRKPAVTKKPTVAKKPANTKKSISVRKPSNSKKPANTKKPGNTKKPVAKKPAAAKKTSPTKKPASIRKSPNTKKPAAPKKPASIRKPANTKKPVTPKKPVAARKHAATKKPTNTKKPAAKKPAAKKPAAPKKLAVVKKPAPIRKPANTKKPTTAKKPVAPKKPSPIRKPTAVKKQKAAKTVPKNTVTKKPNAAKKSTAKHQSKGSTPPRNSPKTPAKTPAKTSVVENASKPSVTKPKNEQVSQGKLNKVNNPCKRSDTDSEAGPSCQLPVRPAPPAQPAHPASVPQTEQIEKARKEALDTLTSKPNEPTKNPKITDVANLFVGTSNDQASIMQSLGHSAQRERKHIVEEKKKNDASLKENEGYIAQNTALMKQQKADLDAKAEAEKAADRERKEKQIAAENVLKGWDTRKEKEAAAVAGNKAIGEDSTQLDQLTDDESS